MKTEYRLIGLDCANCAAKIEREVQKLNGVDNASLSFIKGSLIVEWNDDFLGHKEEAIRKIVHRLEKGVKVSQKSLEKECQQIDDHHCHCGHDHGHDDEIKNQDDHTHGREEGKLLIVRLVIGAIMLGLGLLSEHVFKIDNSLIIISIYVIAFLLLGGDVLFKAFKNIIRGHVFDENFLMSLATIGAFAISEFAEAVGVMLFYQIGEYFQGRAVKSVKKSITKLMDIRPDYAFIIQDGEITKVQPEDVKIGEIIIVKPGEKIPLDGVVIEGESSLDTAALTGESVPRKVRTNDEVLSGSVNQSGVLKIKVSAEFGQSTVSKIIDLVSNATDKKAPTENFITKFARFYTPIVVLLAALLALVPPLFIGIGELAVWTNWIKRGLIFLVISCPCALVISIPLGFFGGLGGASKNGVLIKGGNFLEALNKVGIVVFDKTGTLTKGVFEVNDIVPNGNITKDELLLAAAKGEVFSNHPIAQSILSYYGKEIDRESLKDYCEIAGQGISVKNKEKLILVGNDKLMDKYNIPYQEVSKIGTKVFVAVDGVYYGYIVIADQIKEDSYQLIKQLKARGIKTVMLTGDNKEIANAVAHQLGIDLVFSELLPHQKVAKVEELATLKKKHQKLVFMGDGINDAPVLALSDIGISMGGLGSDAAIEAADVVIMNDEPSKIITAIDVANFTKKIVWQNIVFALVIKGLFLLLGAFGVATMWEAVFADVGVALLAVMNALRVMKKHQK